MQSLAVVDVMKPEVATVDVSQSLVELSEAFGKSHQHGFPVVDEHGVLWGIVTVTDLDRAVGQQLPRRTTVREIGTPREALVVAYP